MTAGIDIVTNDAGELVRRAHARDLGEDVVVALHRLARLTRLHDVENQAFTRQLEQTHKLVVEYCLHAGTNLNLLFAHRVVLIGGQLLKGSRAAYDAALELAEILSWCGGSELTIARDITLKDLKAFADALSAALRSKRTQEFVCPTAKIRLRAVSEAARMRGLEVEYLPLEQRIVRLYASAVVIMRRFFEDLRVGRYVLPPRVKRVAQSLVDLSESKTLAFLGVTEVRNANHDDAGRAVNTAILAVAMAREITTDRSLLAQVAMAAMMHDVGRPRALQAIAGASPSGAGIIARLSEDAEDQLCAGTAAVLTALGRLNEATIARTVVTYEAQWLRRARTQVLYSGVREPTIHSKIIALARRYNDILTPEPGLTAPTPDFAIAKLAQEFTDPAGRTILRMLVSSLGLFPVGTLVILSTGETAEVVASGYQSACPNQPRVRLVMDARGGLITRPTEVDLANAPASMGSPSIARVLSVDGWIKGLQAAAPPAEVVQEEPEEESAPPPAAPLPPLPPVAEAPAPEPPSRSLPSSSRAPEESVGSATGPSVARSLGWSRAGLGTPPLRPTVPEFRAQTRAPAPPPPEDRTVLQPSPFEVDDSEEADESGTRLYYRNSILPSPPSVLAPALPSATAQGTFGKTPFVHVLVYMLDRDLGGTLVLRDPQGCEHFVYFEAGVPTKIKTGHPIALLGEELLNARLLGPTHLEQMLSLCQKTGALLGTQLVRRKIITAESLHQVLQVQQTRRIEWLVRLPDETQFEFYRDTNLLDSWGGHDGPKHDPLNLILTATRAWKDEARIVSNLRRLKDHPIALHPEATLEGLTLTTEERALVDMIRSKPFTLEEVYSHCLASDHDISALLYMLFATRQLIIPGQKKTPLKSRPSQLPPGPLSRLSTVAAPQALALSGKALLGPGPIEERAYSHFPSRPTGLPPSLRPSGRQPTSMPGRAWPDEAPTSPTSDLDPSRASEPNVPLASRPTRPSGGEQSRRPRGDLSVTPLIHVLVYALDHASTGSVVLREPEGFEHIIYFHQGAPAKVKTGRPLAPLGQALLASHDLSPQQLDEALSAARTIDALLGEYLILEDLVSRPRIMQALATQVPDKIVQLVNLPRETNYAFYRDVNLLSTWAGSELFPTNPLSLVLAAARTWNDRKRMRAALNRIQTQALRLHPEADLKGLIVSPSEEALLQALQSSEMSIATLVQLKVASEQELEALIYTLAITRQFIFKGQRGGPMTAGMTQRSAGVQLQPQPVSGSLSLVPDSSTAPPPSVAYFNPQGEPGPSSSQDLLSSGGTPVSERPTHSSVLQRSAVGSTGVYAERGLDTGPLTSVSGSSGLMPHGSKN